MSLPVWSLVFGVAGALAGAAHFLNLAYSARRIGHDASATATVLLTVLRFALSGAVLVVAARIGAMPLLAALGGWLLARRWRLRAETAT